MRYRRLGATLIVVAALISWAPPARGFEGRFRVPCEILYRGAAPFVVTCEVTLKTSKGHVLELARTPNGKFFVIENVISDYNKWLLNRKKAVVVSEGPEFCCENANVEVCF
jgi:hypothetical protein